MSYICGGKDIATGIGAAIIVAGDGRFCFALSAEQGGSGGSVETWERKAQGADRKEASQGREVARRI